MAAERFLKTLAGLVKLLEKPDTREVFDQLRMVKTHARSAHLIGFMHVYNLGLPPRRLPSRR